MPAAVLPQRPRVLLRRARLTATILLIVSTLTGMVPVTTPAAVGAQENPAATSVDLDELELQIAYAPHPPTPNETVLLISRITGPNTMLEAIDDWWYDWNVDGNATNPDPRQTAQAQHVTRRQFATTGDRNVSLTICPTPNAAATGCLQASTTITVVAQANRAPDPRFVGGSVAVGVGVMPFDVDPDGLSYYRFEDPRRSPLEADFSRPGIPSWEYEFSTDFVGTFTHTVAACHLEPSLNCGLTEERVTFEPGDCSVRSPAALMAPTALTIGRLDNNAGLRLGWTNDNEADVSYEIEAGPSLDALRAVPAPSDRYARENACETQAVRVTDPAVRCFRVTVKRFISGQGEISRATEACPAIERYVSSSSGSATGYVGPVDLTPNRHGDGTMDLEVSFIAAPGGLSETTRNPYFVNFTPSNRACTGNDWVAIDVDEFDYEMTTTDSTGAPVRSYSAVLPDRPVMGNYDVQVSREPCSQSNSNENPDWIALAATIWNC